MKYRLLGKQNTVILYNEISDDSISFELDNEGIEDKLTGYITVGDKEKAEELLTRLFDRLKNEWNLTEEIFQNNNLHLMSMLVKISMRLNINLNKEIGEDTGIFEILGRLKSIHEAELFFSNLSAKLCAQVKKNASTLETYYLKGIINYINDNFEKDISMDTLSGHIGISASYIHRLFRDELKTTFIKYLTKKRIEKAGEYLKKGMKIKEISEKLGFADPKYFIRVFKKQTGCTPNEVRKTLST